MASISSKTANGMAALNAMKRQAERLGRIALISSFVTVPGMFGGPFVSGLALGLAAASVVAMVGFLSIAGRCDCALLATAKEHRRQLALASGDVEVMHGSESEHAATVRAACHEKHVRGGRA